MQTWCRPPGRPSGWQVRFGVIPARCRAAGCAVQPRKMRLPADVRAGGLTHLSIASRVPHAVVASVSEIGGRAWTQTVRPRWVSTSVAQRHESVAMRATSCQRRGPLVGRDGLWDRARFSSPMPKIMPISRSRRSEATVGHQLYRPRWGACGKAGPFRRSTLPSFFTAHENVTAYLYTRCSAERASSQSAMAAIIALQVRLAAGEISAASR